MNELDPNIPVEFALATVNNNQAELGRAIGLQRAAVNEWLRAGRQFLPPLAAHRFVRRFGECLRRPAG